MFDVVDINLEEDYPELESWWKSWSWDAVPKMFLPTGVMVKYRGERVCAVFIYKTDTPICWIENYISSKDFPKSVRDDCLDLLMEAALRRSREMGFMVAMSAVKHNGLAKRLERFGFNKADDNLTNYIRNL